MWATIRAAMRSWERTGRLCAILTVVNAPIIVVALLR
jgi:hypothetical protein